MTNSKFEWYFVTLNAINIVSTHKVQTTHDANRNINIISWLINNSNITRARKLLITYRPKLIFAHSPSSVGLAEVTLLLPPSPTCGISIAFSSSIFLFLWFSSSFHFNVYLCMSHQPEFIMLPEQKVDQNGDCLILTSIHLKRVLIIACFDLCISAYLMLFFTLFWPVHQPLECELPFAARNCHRCHHLNNYLILTPWRSWNPILVTIMIQWLTRSFCLYKV